MPSQTRSARKYFVVREKCSPVVREPRYVLLSASFVAMRKKRDGNCPGLTLSFVV